MITLSEDGYVRLTFATLQHTPLTHLTSGLDEEVPDVINQGAVVSPISGYTEWISHTVAAITIGWDWRLDVTGGQLHCVRVGPPRSNLMIVDGSRTDMGPTQSALLIEAAIDGLAWWEETLAAVRTKYR